MLLFEIYLILIITSSVKLSNHSKKELSLSVENEVVSIWMTDQLPTQKGKER